MLHYNNSTFTDFEELLKNCIVPLEEHYIYKIFDKNSNISANEREIILDIPFKTIELQKIIYSILEDVKISIEYESMYRDKRYFNDTIVSKDFNK